MARWLLDLGGLSVTHKAVVRLELLQALIRIVDEGETSGLATTEVGAESEDGDLVLVYLVGSSKLLAELVLRDI